MSDLQSIFISLLPFVFWGSIVINLIYWVLIFPAFLKQHKDYIASREKINPDLPYVSIVISARNEVFNLSRLIPLLLDQDYPDFEIVIADDCSTDDTSSVISSYQDQRITLVKVTKETLGKKYALSQAIKKSRYETILLTDADCIPQSRLWIRSMLEYKSNKSLVLGYGPVDRHHGWLNKYIRYETFLTAIQYLSYATLGHTYMGVGRNIGYDRKLFDINKGFDAHMDIPSGDDDLFVNAISDPSDVAICVDRDSFMYSDSKQNFKDYYRQKTRHFSTSTHYKLFDKMSLGLFAMSHILFYTSMIAMMILGFWQVVVIGYLLRIVLLMTINKPMHEKLDVSDLWKYFPFLDFFTMVFYIVFIPASFFPRTKEW